MIPDPTAGLLDLLPFPSSSRSRALHGPRATREHGAMTAMHDEPGWALWPRRVGEAVLLAMACLAPWAYGSVDAWAEFALEVGIAIVTILGLVVGLGTGRTRH